MRPDYHFCSFSISAVAGEKAIRLIPSHHYGAGKGFRASGGVLAGGMLDGPIRLQAN